MSRYLVLLFILKFNPARLATLPYVLDSNVTKPLDYLLTKPSVFYYFLLIVSFNLVSIKIVIIIIIICTTPDTVQLSRNFNAPLFNHSKTQKYYLYQVIKI